jgi:hypothetical protein
MDCARCGSDDVGTTNSRPSPNGRLRRRRCNVCGWRWTTIETPVLDALEQDPTGPLRVVIPVAVSSDRSWAACATERTGHAEMVRAMEPHFSRPFSVVLIEAEIPVPPVAASAVTPFEPPEAV